MKICIFGGTFDPPHIGHLLIAQTVCEVEDFDKILFVPAYSPPHKVQITDILLLFYGLAILLSGIFSAKPFIEEIPYSLLESGLHYAFALSAGMFLNFTIFFHLIFSERTKERLFHLVFLMTIFISSMIIVLIKESELNAPLGLMQRITYLAGLIWLFIFFLKRDKIEIDNKLK